MILHIVVDDKFIDMAYKAFERVYPGKNEFLVISNSKNLKYIKLTPVKIISLKEFFKKSFMEKLSRYEFVVLHWLDDFKKFLVLNAPEKVKFVWIGWGGDYYCYTKKNLFLPLTKDYLDKTNKKNLNINVISGLKYTIKNILFMRKLNVKIDIRELFNKIDFFAPVIKEDYDLVSSAIEKFKPQYISWNYGTLEDDLIKDLNSKISGNNILIGNSATPENNHLDTFKFLENIDLRDRKLICPLNYGDPEYAKYISNKGALYFGNNFYPITEFMSIDEYRDILKSCSVAIMNHLRQQAVGNIIMMLYMGAKVFLNKESPVYSFFNKQGAKIYSTNELCMEEINLELKDEDIERNREILRKHWSRDVILSKTKNMIEVLRDYKK